MKNACLNFSQDLALIVNEWNVFGHKFLISLLGECTFKLQSKVV